MTKPALRAVPETDDTGADFAAGTEFGPVELSEQDFTDLNDAKTLVKRSRDHMQRILDGLTAQKAAIEKRMGDIEERRRVEISAANGRADAELLDADADLAQIGACKEAIDLAVARLNKAA